MIALFPHGTSNMDPAILTVIRYFNKPSVKLSSSHSDAVRRPHSAFGRAQVKYHAEWSPSEVFFMTFGYKCISEQVFVVRFFVTQLSIAAFQTFLNVFT